MSTDKLTAVFEFEHASRDNMLFPVTGNQYLVTKRINATTSDITSMMDEFGNRLSPINGAAFNVKAIGGNGEKLQETILVSTPAGMIGLRSIDDYPYITSDLKNGINIQDVADVPGPEGNKLSFN